MEDSTDLKDRFAQNNLLERLIYGGALGALVLGVVFSGGIFYIVAVVATFLLVYFEWFRIVHRSNLSTCRKVVWYWWGICYAVLPAFALIYISQRADGRFYTMLLILTVWMSDICAYFGGIIIGGAKLSRYSPSKTWSGFISGTLVSSITVLLLFRYALCQFLPAFCLILDIKNVVLVFMIAVISHIFC